MTACRLEETFIVEAMIIVQTLLAIPIIVGLTAIAVRSKGRELRETALGLGAGRLLLLRTLICEARYGILVAVIAGFGRLVAEVGAVMMLGGSIEGKNVSGTCRFAHTGFC